MNRRSNTSSTPSAMGGQNFLVTVYHQENQSWQGVIQWLETGEKIHFRSTLEMLHLIDNATQKVGVPQRNWGEDSKSKAI